MKFKINLFTFLFLIAQAAPLLGLGTKMESQVRHMMQGCIDRGLAVGAVVGIITPQGTKIMGFGRVARDSSAQPDGKTRFETGSLTKAFTTLILLEEIRAGAVRVDDPVTQFFPKDMPFPTRIRTWDEYLLPWKWAKDPPVTFWHLATHTSGFPNMPDITTLPKSWKVADTDYITEDMLREFFLKFRFKDKPGENCVYSIINTGLIGYCLSKKEGKDYDILLDEKVLRPLGLKDTVVFPNDEQRREMAKGYDDEGREAPYIHSSMLTAASGGLTSTIRDMVRFMALTLGLEENPMRPMLQKECEPLVKTNEHFGRTLGYGCYFMSKGNVVYQGGKTRAFRSFIAMVPDRKIGVVLWGNCVKFPAGEIADRILGILEMEGTGTQDLEGDGSGNGLE